MTFASRRLVAVLLFASAGFVPEGSVLAADTTDAPHPGREAVSLTTSLVTPFFNAYYLEGKLRATRNVAVIVNTSYLALSNEGWTARTGTLGVGVDYYFRGDALRGWYVEGITELWLSSMRHAASGKVASLVVGYEAGAILGYQLVFDRGLVLDFGAGVVAFHLPRAQIEAGGETLSSAPMTRIYPALKVDVGWAF